ncbi:MAG: DNA polymerase III subunit gamma/tau, partial [Bacteroidota bacterium]
TLEEPPPHAIFILATTEKHKIIPTILSRCQIFDFQRIGVGDMVQHLTDIAEKEGIQAEKEALHVVAQKADGALRDALSIFDQMVSFSGKTLTYQDVIRNLNVLDYDYYFKVTEAMLGGNIPQSLLLLDEILHKGFDGHHFVTGLAAHFRDLLVCQDASTLKLLEVAESIQARYREQATACAPEWLLKGLGIISRADVQYKASKNQRLLVELALMQLASLGRSPEKKTEAGSIAPPPKIIESQSVKQKIAAVSQETPPAQPTPTPPTPPAPQPAAAPMPVSAPAAPAPKPVKTPATMARLRSNMVSINDQLHPAGKPVEDAESVVAEEQASYANKPQDRFTEEDLMAHWKNYCEQIQQQGMGPLYGVLSKRPPKLGKNFEVMLTLDNSVEESILINDKADLQAHLREQLNNHALHIEYTITKQKEDKKPYTDRERFERLAERNPNLMKLKQKLDLEI